MLQVIRIELTGHIHAQKTLDTRIEPVQLLHSRELDRVTVGSDMATRLITELTQIAFHLIRCGAPGDATLCTLYDSQFAVQVLACLTELLLRLTAKRSDTQRSTAIASALALVRSPLILQIVRAPIPSSLVSVVIAHLQIKLMLGC